MLPLYGGHQKGLTSKISGILAYLGMRHTTNITGNIYSQIHTCVIFWFKCKDVNLLKSRHLFGKFHEIQPIMLFTLSIMLLNTFTVNHRFICGLYSGNAVDFPLSSIFDQSLIYSGPI